MIEVSTSTVLNSPYLVECSPWRLIDDGGGAFSMGLIGGSIFNFLGGARHAPSGLNHRAIGGLVRLKERAPVLGGQVGSGCISGFDGHVQIITFDCEIARPCRS